MRKLKLQMQTLPDGFVAGPKGEMDWMEWNWDEALKSYVQEITTPVDCILLGRKLAEGFIPHWTSQADDPKTADDFARKMVNTSKIVFSKTLQKMEGENTEVENGDLTSAITQIKQQAGQDIIVYGGGGFVSSLIKENLIDEYYLFVNPTAIGSGMTIFASLEQKRNLNLVHAHSFACGIVVLSYTPDRA